MHRVTLLGLVDDMHLRKGCVCDCEMRFSSLIKVRRGVGVRNSHLPSFLCLPIVTFSLSQIPFDIHLTLWTPSPHQTHSDCYLIANAAILRVEGENKEFQEYPSF